jgi:hypothetical protein
MLFFLPWVMFGELVLGYENENELCKEGDEKCRTNIEI